MVTSFIPDTSSEKEGFGHEAGMEDIVSHIELLQSILQFKGGGLITPSIDRRTSNVTSVPVSVVVIGEVLPVSTSSSGRKKRRVFLSLLRAFS